MTNGGWIMNDFHFLFIAQYFPIFLFSTDIYNLVLVWKAPTEADPETRMWVQVFCGGDPKFIGEFSHSKNVEYHMTSVFLFLTYFT